MKKNILFLFLFLNIGNIEAQTEVPCDPVRYQKYYDQLMQEADNLVKENEYEIAVKKYVSALIICPQNIEAIAGRINTVFQKIDALKRVSQHNEQKAAEHLMKATKLIKAFYFAYDRFALAFKDRKFYFIDKNGDKIKKLGEWKKAEQFTDNGFAKVWQGNTEYYLDTTGRTYPIAYSLQEMDTTKTALNLSGNQYDIFPQVICDYPQLELLFMNGEHGKENQFTKLPPSIQNLKNLKVVQLKYAKIDSLPQEIKHLKKIRYLDLYHNRLKYMPPEIGELHDLKELYLKSNQLEALPPEIGQLKKLIALSVSNNKLRDLPSELGQLEQLTKIYLYGNQLTKLPSEIGQLKKLIYLDLYNNQLQKLPAEIGQLNNLTLSSFENNQLKKLPIEIGDLQYLTKLDLYNNQLQVLPEEIGQLKNLTELYLHDNQLENLPLEIGQLEKLTKLSLNNNKLIKMPFTIQKLKRLKYLYLSGNPIPKSEQEIIKTWLPNCEINF